MKRLKSIEETAIACARGEEVCFVLTDENWRSMFTFCYYQLKYKTRNDFRCIVYQRPKGLLYYFLRLISIIFAWRYTLIYEEASCKKEI